MEKCLAVCAAEHHGDRAHVAWDDEAMRAFLITFWASALYACSSGGGKSTDATGTAGTGAGGTTDAAGTTGAGGTGSAACDDKPEAESGCAATLAAQLAAPTCATGGVTKMQEKCGTNTNVSFSCGYFTSACVYDAQDQLLAWRFCSDTIGPCGDFCSHGGRHVDGGLTTFFPKGQSGACYWAPPAP
jgi:hypothetical protein